MVTLVLAPDDELTIPDWVVDLESFRRWTDDDTFPEEGRICFIQGKVWIDMSKEQLFTHGQVKAELAFVIRGLVKSEGLGLFWPDGIYLSNPDADIGVKPDGVFVAADSLRTDRVRLVEGRHAGFVELEGSPDLVLEIVSDGSVRKDNVVLRKAYWEAGAREYWLVDARSEPLTFDIFRHTTRGYSTTRKSEGWVKSAVFGKSFRLTQSTGALGYPEYTLAVR